VRRVRILASARADIATIYSYIKNASGSDVVAKRFTHSLTEQCRHLGRLSAVLGRARPELRRDIRSFPFKNYIILLRYIENAIEIINVIESHRDLDAIFRKDE
jgi:plasmid stabilization system protein ParE